MLRVGTILYGYCGGVFGGYSYSNKRVEAVGADWVVAREIEGGEVVFANAPPEAFEDDTVPTEDFH